MNNQEAFDIIWRGLKSQDFRKSVNETGGCCYRGPNGKKCPVGWLIPDEEYDIRWDDPHDSTAIEDLEDAQAAIPGFTPELLPFLITCQEIHDGLDGDMEGGFRELARRTDLTIPAD